MTRQETKQDNKREETKQEKTSQARIRQEGDKIGNKETQELGKET